MRIVEITENKMSDLYEYAEKMLKYGGKMMLCLEEMKEKSSMGHRGGSMGNRYGERDSGGGYGNRYEDRDGGYGERDWEEDEEYSMGERRGVRGTGRYSRYR